MGSWFYLKSGFKYRKEAFAELGNFGKAEQVKFIYPNGSVFTTDTNHVVLILLDKTDEATFDNFAKIIKAYSQRNDVSSLKIVSDSTWSFPGQKGIQPMHISDSTLSSFNDIKTKITNNKQHDINTILINSKSVVVNGYDINIKDEMAHLIKHVSILLPGNKKVDVPSKIPQKEK